MIVLLSNALIATLSVLVLFLIYFCLKLSKNEKLIRYRQKLEKKLFWSAVLKLNSEMHLILCVVVCIQFKYMDFDSPVTSLSSVLNIFLAFYIIGAVVMSAYIVNKHKDKLNTRPMKEKYGTLFEALNYKRSNSNWVIQEPLINNIRVALMGISLLFLSDYPYFQIFYTNMSVTFMVIYIEWCEVYALPSDRFWNVFNEVFIMLLNYHVLSFANLIQDNETRNIMGWSMVTVLSINIGINFINISFKEGTKTYKDLRLRYYTYKRDKLLAKKKKLEEPQISPRILYLQREMGVDITDLLFRKRWEKKYR